MCSSDLFGSRTVRFDQEELPEPALLAIESNLGWVTNEFHPCMITVSRRFLKPGAERVLVIPYREGDLRWRLKYRARAASIEDRMYNWLPEGYGRWIYRLPNQMRLDKEGPVETFWSDVYDIPQ